MAGAIWPLTLPQTPLISGYSETMPSTLLRSETETGPAKVRRRGNAKPVTVQASYILNTEQMELLDTFVYEIIGGGAVCFDWPRPRFKSGDGGYVRARLIPASDGLYSRSVVDSTTDFWNVTLSLEIFPNIPTIN